MYVISRCKLSNSETTQVLLASNLENCVLFELQFRFRFGVDEWPIAAVKMEFKMNAMALTVALFAMVLMVNTAMAAFDSDNQILGEEYDETQSE